MRCKMRVTAVLCKTTAGYEPERGSWRSLAGNENIVPPRTANKTRRWHRSSEAHLISSPLSGPLFSAAARAPDFALVVYMF